MTYYFETYGCEMNIAESASLKNIFLQKGWQETGDASVCDVAVVNSCSIRKSAEERVLGRLGYFLGQKRVRGGLPILIFTGCTAQRLISSIKTDYPFIDYVLDNFHKDAISSVIDKINNNVQFLQTQAAPLSFSQNDEYRFFASSYEIGKFSQFVPIMHGCNNFCTYCVVPYLRGREVSRPVDDILRELGDLSKKGIVDVTLLGQNVNSYKSPAAPNFASLMSIIAKFLHDTESPIRWVRFLSSHPKDLTDGIIEVLKSERVFAHHIHLPIQSGSDRILSLMNRKYTRADYLATIKKLRLALLDVSISTDIMVGFPGETDADFDATLSLMDEVKFTSAMMYYYNEREGTQAAKMEQLPVELRKARLQTVITKQLSHTQVAMAKYIGKTLPVLAEKTSRDNANELLGVTEYNTKVAFAAPQSFIGKVVDVQLIKLNGNTYSGTMQNCSD